MDQSQQQNNGMNQEQRKQTIASGIWGGIVIAVILLLTTIWVSGSARNGTSQAVARVSEFYLEELAGRSGAGGFGRTEKQFCIYGKCP